MKTRDKKDEFVLLAQTGMQKEDMQKQLAKLLASDALEGKTSEKKPLKYLVGKSVAGKVPPVPEITKAVFNKHTPGDTRARTEARKLRDTLSYYYSSDEAKSDEILFDIPQRQYGVFAAKLPTGTPQFPAPPASAMAHILEPAQNADVTQRVPVRGRIDALHPDLRPWLIVETPVGDHYPQCWISRSAPTWENEVRIGLAGWGADEGAVYVIHLVAVGIEGDSAFYTYMKSGRDGFGPILPADCLLLDKKRVTRRDIR